MIGSLGIEFGTAGAIRQLADMGYHGATEGLVRYWTKKERDVNLHNRGWGGARHLAFGDYPTDTAMQKLLLEVIRVNPKSTVGQLRVLMEEHSHVGVSPSWVARTIQSWDWTWTKPKKVSWRKFLPHNVEYYCRYALDILSQSHHDVR